MTAALVDTIVQAVVLVVPAVLVGCHLGRPLVKGVGRNALLFGQVYVVVVVAQIAFVMLATKMGVTPESGWWAVYDSFLPITAGALTTRALLPGVIKT